MGFRPVCEYMQWLRGDADADMYGYKTRIDADWEAPAGLRLLDAAGGKTLRIDSRSEEQMARKHALSAWEWPSPFKAYVGLAPSLLPGAYPCGTYI